MSQSPENQVFEFQKAQLHYHKTGKGNKVLLAFHGFGQSKQHFIHFSQPLRDTYTIYSFDLFYHGMSFWHEKEKPMKKQFWTNLLNEFFKVEGIKTCSLAGYSMGGKFALATLEAFPEKIEKLILIAPDGIKTSFWYSLATYPSWIRRFFRSLIVNPKPFHLMVDSMSKIGLMDKGIIKFASSQMNTRGKRRRVYYTWVVFRLLKFDMELIASLVNKHNIGLEMFLGKYDKVIILKNMQRLLKKTKKYDLHILECGHNTLIDEVAKFYENKKLKVH
ncbi:MAG: alpha/beta hydrolase [Bacteroidota bacterium]|nr:alpha/beta hydrolase [Bacteroidota bacterium]